MTLASIKIEDFWKELDARLDAKLDARLGVIENRLTVLEEKVDKMAATVDKIQNWTDRQDRVLERESTISIYNYLRNKTMGSHVVRPVRGFPKEIHDANGKLITEFDGVVVLTTNANYEKQIYAKMAVDPAFEYRVIIIEAKQHLSLKKYKRKLAQRDKIEALLRDKANLPPLLKAFGFDLFEPQVGLYFGPGEMDPSVVPRLQMDARDNEWMGWLDLSGARYVVKDTGNAFGDALEGYALTRGGRRRRRAKGV